eukprot:TRINITY_DN27165_c0_g1_i1.p1 TRINITY_DN27165_c0_g1~~TRINITY_DN27165_c0_g1_i1.p1  ORF type:complete len:163 (+),score=15.33 TRINITY_DN27165_c0_g1_i1:176-664(+)
MCKKLRSVRQVAERKPEVGALGNTRTVVREFNRKMTRVRPMPQLAVNAGIIERVRYNYNWWMHVFEKHNKQVQKGEMNYLYSIHWIYLHAAAAIAVTLAYMYGSWVAYNEDMVRKPALDERRKDFDPFEANADTFEGALDEEPVYVDVKSLRKDSSFSARGS